MKNLSSPIGNIASNFWWEILHFSQNEFCDYKSQGNSIGEWRRGGGGGHFPSHSQPTPVYTIYHGTLATSAQIIYIFLSKISKMYFFGKSRFFLNIQADMCQRCQGSKGSIYYILGSLGRPRINFVPNMRTTVSFKSWYVTHPLVGYHMDFTCFSGGHQFRHFLFDPIKLRHTRATSPPKVADHMS